MNKKLNNMLIKLVSPAIIILGIILFSGAVVFADFTGEESFLSHLRYSVKITLSASVNRSGKKVSLEKAGSIRPGEIIDWKIISHNVGKGPARGYKATGKIPVGTEFVAGSAKADGAVAIRYSVDKGKSFSEKPMVSKKQADGSKKLVSASADMYTQVQFVWRDPLNAGKKLNAFYSVRVK